MKVSKISLFNTFAILCLFGTAVVADDFPDIKQGLWKSTFTEDGKEQSAKQCFGGSQTVKSLFEQGKKSMAGACSEFRVTGSGSTYNSKVTCNLGISKMTIISEASGDFSTKYEVASTTTWNPPLMGKSTSKTKGTSTYVGPCEPGMKPGDIVLSDGTKMNIGDMTKKSKEMSNKMSNMKGQMEKLKGIDMQQLQRQMQEMMKGQ